MSAPIEQTAYVVASVIEGNPMSLSARAVLRRLRFHSDIIRIRYGITQPPLIWVGRIGAELCLNSFYESKVTR